MQAILRRCFDAPANLTVQEVAEQLSALSSSHLPLLANGMDKGLLSVIHNNLGLALHRAGELQIAQAEFNLILKTLDPKSACAHNNLGVVLQKQKGRGHESVQDLLEISSVAQRGE